MILVKRTDGIVQGIIIPPLLARIRDVETDAYRARTSRLIPGLYWEQKLR
ncbi:MAG: hypothetical protein ACREDH_02805 [Methylocella sp.]